MNRKGLEQLVKHVPELSTPLGVLRLFVFPILLLFLVNAFFIFVESRSWLFWSLLGEIGLCGLGFGWLYQFFRVKNDFKTRFGPLAYSKAGSWFGLPAVTLIAAAAAHLRTMPGPAIANDARCPFRRTLRVIAIDEPPLLPVR